MDDLRKLTYGILIAFVLMLVLWVSYLTLRGCGPDFNCAAAASTPVRTPIPTLVPATQPEPNRALGAATAAPISVEGGAEGTSTPVPTETVPRPSNPGGPGPALDMVGDARSGQVIFEDNCQACHNTQGIGGSPNPGSSEGTVPALNPIDPLLKGADRTEFAYNIDLFIEHGSTPPGPNPTFTMLAWGDDALLTPQEIADVIAYVLQLNP